MAIRQNKKEVIDEFLDLMYKEIRTRYSEDAGIKNVVFHLIEKGLIEPKRLRNYMIISDFHKILKDNNGHSTHTFMDLSIKYDVSDRTCQNVVYKESKKSKRENNII
jgi:hypothetical protein|tara:strand:- start:1188 stop:1508 length:321 start_codon:yes stop_codon:yes gene_type:complete